MRSFLIPGFLFLAAGMGHVSAAGSCALELTTEPAGALATWPSGTPTPTPLRTTLPSGSHDLRLTLAGWSDTVLQVVCDSGTIARSATLRRSKAWSDSVKSARTDSLSKARREYARKTLAQATEDIPSVLVKLSSHPSIQRDTASPPTLAVLPFQATGGTSPEAATTASETAVLHLAGDRRWKLVEREKFQSVLQEQALWGAMGTSADLEIGRSLEARYLLLGTVTTDGLRRLVAMRLVDAVDGRVVAVGATRVEGPAMDAALEDALGEKLGTSGAVFRSLVMPGWGQFWTDRPVRGSFWLVASAGLAGTFAWSLADWSEKDNIAEDYKNKDAATFGDGNADAWLARANQAVADRNEAADRNMLLGSALAATWALNVADAAWCGWRSSKATRSRYFAAAPVITPTSAGIRLAVSLGGASR